MKQSDPKTTQLPAVSVKRKPTIAENFEKKWAASQAARAKRAARRVKEAAPVVPPMRIVWHMDTMKKAVPDKVYFIACEQFVKIGCAANVRRRMTDHQISVPFKLTLLGTIPGGHEMENMLHLKYDHLHVRGEWFRMEGELAEYIASLSLTGDA